MQCCPRHRSRCCWRLVLPGCGEPPWRCELTGWPGEPPRPSWPPPRRRCISLRHRTSTVRPARPRRPRLLSAALRLPSPASPAHIPGHSLRRGRRRPRRRESRGHWPPWPYGGQRWRRHQRRVNRRHPLRYQASRHPRCQAQRPRSEAVTASRCWASGPACASRFSDALAVRHMPAAPCWIAVRAATGWPAVRLAAGPARQCLRRPAARSGRAQ